MTYPSVTEQDQTNFQRDGYVLKRAFFDLEEMGFWAKPSRRLRDSGQYRLVKDGAGGSTELALWNQPGDDLFGAFARCRGSSTAWSGCWAARSTTTIPS